MSTNRSVAQVLADLEARIAHHREKAALHAQQEVYNREQSAFHAAELAKVTERYEAFKATAAAVAELAPPPTVREEPAPEPGQRVMASKLIVRVVESLGAEPFGARSVAVEVNRRYRAQLKRPVDSRDVSSVLRRLRDAGRIHRAREGKAFHEAQYTRRRPG